MGGGGGIVVGRLQVPKVVLCEDKLARMRAARGHAMRTRTLILT